MRNLFKFLLLAAVAVAGVACEDKEEEGLPPIRDFITYPVEFAVEDAETGEDLLDPATEGNILEQEIKVIYNGTEYPRWTKAGLGAWFIEDITSTRYNMPMPFALRWGWSISAYSYLVAFGEFDPTQDFHQESFIIDWGDGTQNEIILDCYITWKGYDPTVHTALWVDGNRSKSWLIVIKK